MISFVLSAAAKNRVSRSAHSFADSRKTADPRTEKRSLLVNLDKQPTHIHRPDGSQIDFTYDSAGRVATTTYPSLGGNVTVTRTYSPTTGKLAGVSTSDGQSLAYTYDGSLPLSTTWSGIVAGSVSRTYDNNFRVATELVNGANSVALGYDNDGLLTSAGALTLVRDPTNGTVSTATVGTLTSTYQYTTYGELKDVTVTQASTPIFEEKIPDNGFGRDSLGRIQQKTETIQGVSHTYNYSYDSAGRLWQVSQDGTVTATYTYDTNGNRISGPGVTTTPVYDAQDRLLNYGKWACTYTANGGLLTKTDTTSGQVTSYSYDGMGNLRHVGLPDSRAIDYVIDSLNRRVGKKVNGSVVRRWVYGDGLTPAAEFDGNGNLVSRFVGTNYIVQGSTTYRIVKDHLGSPRLIVNATTGAVAQRLDYDEWGNVTVSGTQPAGWQPFGFAGGIYDPDTGLVRFGARDYDPVVGRWTSKDPIRFGGRQANLYVYVGNNPMNSTDPSGLGPIPVCAQNLLSRYFPGLDLSKVDIQVGIPLITSMLDSSTVAQTTGPNEIHLREDMLDFSTQQALSTLAHELTHVDQGQNSPDMFSSSVAFFQALGFGNATSEALELQAIHYEEWVIGDLNFRMPAGCPSKCE
jgi:RHS repeat-associated protein